MKRFKQVFALAWLVLFGVAMAALAGFALIAQWQSMSDWSRRSFIGMVLVAAVLLGIMAFTTWAWDTWRYRNETSPDMTNQEVHHLDGDPRNNTIENLSLRRRDHS